MKKEVFLIEIVVGTEYERMSIIKPNGQVAFEGNTEDGKDFLAAQIARVKFNSKVEDESK